MKLKLKKILKNLLFLLLFSLIFLGIGYIIAILISHRFNYLLRDVMFCESFIWIMIGTMMSMKGNPSGTNFNGIGNSNVNAISFRDLEVTRMERESKPYYKDFLRNNVVEFAFGNLTFILGGIFMIVFCILFL